MNYTILIFDSPADIETRKDPEAKHLQSFWAQWPPYIKALQDAGIFGGGAGLNTPDTATTLKFVGDRRFVQDGPFAETKEQLGGFVVINNVPNLDVALDWAARCPRLPGQSIEVRPNMPPRR